MTGPEGAIRGLGERVGGGEGDTQEHVLVSLSRITDGRSHRRQHNEEV